MAWTRTLLVGLLSGLLAQNGLLAQPACTITQITNSSGYRCIDPSLDEGSIAFASQANLTGDNPDENYEIFLFDGNAISQVTDTKGSWNNSLWPSLEGDTIAFVSSADLTGGKQHINFDIFLFDGSAIRQITNDDRGDSGGPSLDGGSVAFSSTADHTPGGASFGSLDVFYFDGSEVTQISKATSGESFSGGPSLDRGSIAFTSNADLTGENPDGASHIFLFDGSAFQQITPPSARRYSSSGPSLDRGSIAFESRDVRTLPQPPSQIHLYDGANILQITDSTTGGSYSPSLHRGAVAFHSFADLTGGNPDGNYEIFLFHRSTITQVTDSVEGRSFGASLSGDSIAFSSNADLTGSNPDKNYEIFLATCPTLGPPPGPYLSSDQIPDFRFKVRITAGDQVVSGGKQADCVPDTLCVSGALPGRSELFVRLIGPRPNGFLWTNLVRFTTSRVEVWAEQISTGQINYYDLPALPREDTELTGLVDKEAFELAGSTTAVPASDSLASIRARPLTAFEPIRRFERKPQIVPGVTPATFTPEAFPDYRFTVRIFSGVEEQPVQLESDCIPETVCVSGALPGRSELFLRIIGPRPNGFLWVNLVRFTTSRVEVEIEQLSTGDRNTYVLDPVPRESNGLPGRVDKEAFSPE